MAVSKSQPPKPLANGLVDRYFHVFDGPRSVQYQGRIVARITEDVFLVELFEWFSGSRSGMRLVYLQSMISAESPLGRDAGSWQLYDSAEEMISWYETYHKRDSDGPITDIHLQKQAN